uniref:G_PROTEIN_RECEP_F1_2 domain-containing protein n=1 Tax=Mesocestoides corti TaxID=53468 RepID=A0A5K3F0B3_MESCO
MLTNASAVSLSSNLPNLLKCIAGFVFAFSICLANVIIIVALLHLKKYLTRQTQIFLLNMASVDLLTGIFIVPPLMVIDLPGNNMTYDGTFHVYWLTGGGLLLNGRVFALFLIALDRYLSICRPMRYPNLLTFSRARLSLMFSWGLAFVIILPQLIAFTAELVGQTRNVTSTSPPYDWTYSTTFALRVILVFMFILRFVFPLTAAVVINVLAFRVAIASSKGFRLGVLKVKEPEHQLNNEDGPPKNLSTSHGLSESVPKKTVQMRIHRGNYMTVGTKELFAQLPCTSRTLGSRLSRRTAVVPNVDLDGSQSTRNFFREADTISRHRQDGASVNGQENEGERNSKAAAALSNIPARSIITSDGDLQERDPSVHQTTSHLIDCERNTMKSRPTVKVAWWRSARSHSSLNKFRQRHKKLKDLGSMIPFTVLLSAFILFSLPYQFVQVLQALWITPHLSNETQLTLFWLACTNALINPVVLTFWSSACRAKVLHLVSCGRFHPNQMAIKRLIIASFGTANLPYGRHVRPRSMIS